jgi:hypothetical protein
MPAVIPNSPCSSLPSKPGPGCAAEWKKESSIMEKAERILFEDDMAVFLDKQILDAGCTEWNNIRFAGKNNQLCPK